MTVEISKTHPAELTCAWLALPAKGVALPLFMGCTVTPKPLVDGELYLLTKDIDGARNLWETTEESVHASKELLVTHIAPLLEKDQTNAASALLDDWAVKNMAAQVESLRFWHDKRAR